MPDLQGHLWFGWCGWRIRMPADWRPVRIEGEWQRGTTVLGDGDMPVLQIKWWRPEQKRFKADRWIEKRLRKMKAGATAASAPQPEGFTATRWAPGEPDCRSFWYGYHAGAHLMLEVVVSPEVSRGMLRMVEHSMLRSIAADAKDDPTRWSVYAASFTAPPEFQLSGQHLHLGDVALLVKAKKNRRLVLRQIYPAELALGRRKLDRWLGQTLFKQRRKFKPREEPVSRTFDLNDRALEGYEQHAVRQIAWPLGWIRRRQLYRAAVHDPERKRLLICEYEAPRKLADEQVVMEALAGMNWAMDAPSAE